MPIVNIVDDKQYPFKVFAEDADTFRIAESADNDDCVITFQMQKVGYEDKCNIDDKLMLSKKDKTFYHIGTNQLALMRKAVKGWSNILLPDGSEYAYSYANLSNLPPKLIKLLEEHVVDVNGIRGDKEKN